MPKQIVLLLYVLTVYCLYGSSDGSTPTATSNSSTEAATSTTTQQPPFCKSVHEAAYTGAHEPTTMSWAGNMLKVYRNLYHHNKKWYAVVDSSSTASAIDAGISANSILMNLPTTDTKAFQQNLKVCYVPGVTLYIDFPFAAFPDNLGHWAEILLPMYSVFSNPNWRQQLQGGHQHIDRILLANVKPEHLYNWPKEMLALSVDPAVPPWPAAAAAVQQHNPAANAAAAADVGKDTAADAAVLSSTNAAAHEAAAADVMRQVSSTVNPKPRLPPGAVPWDKPLPQLLGDANVSGWCAHGWMVFENMVVVQDRYPILSMPDRKLPEPPSAAAAAARLQGSLGAKDLHSEQQHACTANGHTDGTCEVPVITTAVGSTDVPKAADSAAAVAEQQPGFWKTPYQVGFNRPELAVRFKTAAHARQLWELPGSYQQQQRHKDVGFSSSSGSSIPRVVTVLLYPEDYPPVVNHYELVDMLRDLTEPYGFKVRTVSLTMGAPFLSHMATVADTGILIGRHGPLLATAMLLPPGAAVLELLPYKWEWRGVSSLYYNMTQSTGHIHHWAWRPLHAKWCKYKDAAHARYAGWTTSECHGRECLLVHAQAGLIVDLEAVRGLLSRKLPGLIQGRSVQELLEPWPPAE